MSSQCFCGCGKRIPKFPLGIRSINKRGQQVRDRLEWAAANGVTPASSPDLTGWFEDGHEIAQLLAGAMHGQVDPMTLDERSIRAWQAEGRSLVRQVHQRMTEMGGAFRRSGMSVEDAATALAAHVANGGDAASAMEALRDGRLGEAGPT